MNTPRIALSVTTAAWLAATGAAFADVLHASAGLTPSMLGYAKPLGSNVTLRADLASLPGVGRESSDAGVASTGHVKTDRAALFMDWAFAGAMRLTGGMAFNRTRVDLRAGSRGGAPMLGDVPYATAQNDRFDGALRAPHTLPYLGVGNGQYGDGGSSLLLDIDGTFARASLSHNASGPSLVAVSQGALDHELAQLRDGIGRVRFMPQLSLGMRLRF